MVKWHSMVFQWYSVTDKLTRLLFHDNWPGDCFTNVSRALQNILSKFVFCRIHTSYENFKLKLCTCAQSHALDTRTKFQLEILTINVISGIVYFRKIILGSSRNVSETTPRAWMSNYIQCWNWSISWITNLYSQLGYFTEVFQGLQRLVLAVFLMPGITHLPILC